MAAGTALAGLMLVFIGSQATGFGSYGAEQQHAVRRDYQRKAWLAFSGLVLAFLAVVLAMFGKSADVDPLVTAGAVALLIGLVVAGVAAFITVQEIR